MRLPFSISGIKWTLSLVCLLFATSGCIRLPGEYHHYRLISKQSWSKQDTLLFEDSLSISPEQMGLSEPFHYSVCIRHNTLYPYENLHLILSSQFGHFSRQDTLGIGLVKSNHHWKGKGWGSSYSVEQEICLLDRSFIMDYIQAERDSITDPYAHLPIEIYGRPEDAYDSKGIFRIPFKIQIVSGMTDSKLVGIEGIGIHLK